MADKLSNTLSDVEFYMFNDYYYCDWEDLVAMLLDLFSMPHNKDHTWPAHVQPIFVYIPSPLMFKRGWDALAPHLSDADWGYRRYSSVFEAAEDRENNERMTGYLIRDCYCDCTVIASGC